MVINTPKNHVLYELQDYIDKYYHEWKKIDPDNIVGVHVAKKIRKNSVLNYYAIVFHVKKKKPETILGLEKIPSQFQLNLINRKRNIVTTDVLETGLLNFESFFEPSHKACFKDSSPG